MVYAAELDARRSRTEDEENCYGTIMSVCNKKVKDWNLFMEQKGFYK